MNRRLFGIALAASLAGCAGAGVSATDLRGKVAAEVAQVLVNHEQLSPWTVAKSVDPARVDAAIHSVQTDVAFRHMTVFSVEQLHDLRRFYSLPDGQAVTALAFAAEGQKNRPTLDPEQFTRVKTAFNDPVMEQSLSILRDVLREAFVGAFAF